MEKKERNYAFIDGQNLNLGVRELGWKLDLYRFRVYLKEKYNVERAYYFIGFVSGNNALYASLQKWGYILVFKPTFVSKEGKVKGNCDAELVLQAMIDFKEYNKVVIVTGDGDFYCLVRYLREQRKLKMMLCPNRRRYSGLLKKSAGSNLSFINDLKNKLALKRKEPHKNKIL